MIILFIGLIISLCVYCDHVAVISWQRGLAVLLLLVFIFLNRKDKIAMYVIQLGLVLLCAEVYWNTELGIFSKIFSILLFVSYIIFSIERRTGCNISKFSALDLLMIMFTIGGIVLSYLGFAFSTWFFLTLFSLWFGLRFILLRTDYLGS